MIKRKARKEKGRKGRWKGLLFASFAMLFFAYFAFKFAQPATATRAPASDLYISVSLTKMERSRDSNSRKTTITVSGNKIVYERIYRGAGSKRIEPVRKEFKITDEELKRLGKVVADHDLLTSGSLEYPHTGGGFLSFEISLDVRFDGKQSSIVMSGPSKAAGVSDEKLYKNSKALLEEIFRILTAQDEEIRYEDDLVIQTRAVD
jgi:hypothetical protein